MAYLLGHILQRPSVVQSKVDDDNMAVRVSQRAKTVVFLSAACVPRRKFDGGPGDFDLPYGALEHSRDIILELRTIAHDVRCSR
jgi:hypothetical protein